MKQLDKQEKKQSRSQNFQVDQTTGQFLEVQAWQLERVREGIRAADEGRFVSDYEMARIFNKYEDQAR